MIRHDKTVDSITTTHVLDGANVIADITGNVTAYYTRGVNILWDSNGAYYLFNAHSDVVAVVSSATETIEYDAFGNIISGELSSPFMYCGEYRDDETGLYYLRARYYDPAICRFIQQDAWDYINLDDPLSLNLYTYCVNNPILYIDPSGHSLKDTLHGMSEAILENITGGFVVWLINKVVRYDTSYSFESEYDYYLGRTAGNVISLAIGVGMTLSGVVTIIGSVVGGAAITVGSGGTLLIGGVAVCVEGVVVGAATVVAGGATVAAAAANFGSDLNKLQTIGRTNKETLAAAEKLGYKKTNYYSDGKPVYERVSGNGPKYITPDRTSHNGGSWKGADTVKNLGSNTTRAGTYDANLNRIGK